MEDDRVNLAAAPHPAPMCHVGPVEFWDRADAACLSDHCNGLISPDPRSSRADGPRTDAVVVSGAGVCPETRPAGGAPAVAAADDDGPDLFCALFRWVVAWWHPDHQRLALALDASPLGQRFTVLSLCGVIRGCAIPVAWNIVAATKSGMECGPGSSAALRTASVGVVWGTDPNARPRARRMAVVGHRSRDALDSRGGRCSRSHRHKPAADPGDGHHEAASPTGPAVFSARAVGDSGGGVPGTGVAGSAARPRTMAKNPCHGRRRC